jgi:hypothetical protein
MRASVFELARSMHPAWGEPARPGLPPEGETGKGAIKLSCAAGGFRNTLPRGEADVGARVERALAAACAVSEAGAVPAAAKSPRRGLGAK